MAKPGTPASHGPAPRTFKSWCVSVGRKGCRKFRVKVEGQREPSIVAFSTGAGSARTIEKMGALSVEALDDDGAILRIWQFKEVEALEPEAPGYLKEEGDTEDERLLKTFAHLLADAHRTAVRELREVVNIQASSFSEERKQLTALRMLNDKLLATLARRTRFRVATTGPEDVGEGEEDGSEADEKDDFMADLLRPMLQQMVAKAARKAVGAEAAETQDPKANGAKE